MLGKWTIAAVLGLLTWPAVAAAADERRALPLHLLSVAPFVLLLLAIAVLPLVAEHFWHKNRNKAVIAVLLAAPVAVYLVWHSPEAVALLRHQVIDYVAFIALLGSLYTVSGGIALLGDIRGRPLTNTGFLAFGSVLANVVGTTGASMLLIRPLLRTNRQRRHTRHLPVFFIFTVSNLGGLLTPLGDPPLFLGFLHGVPFLWTLSLWRPWLVVNGIVLGLFLVWDTLAYLREPGRALVRDIRQAEPLRLRGWVNFILLAGILAVVLLQSRQVSGPVRQWLSRLFDTPDLTLSHLGGAAAMAVLALLSLALTPRGVRAANEFGWGAITEVAVLFAGIFVAMVPALELVKFHRASFGVTEPWQFFWLTGALSSFLDNAPTYMTFATLAAGSDDFSGLVREAPRVLAAVSCGAVFMGANTYIGNGPNFMVKAIAEEAGYRMPSFFGYMLYSGLILLPVFGLVTYLFFGPG